MLVAAVAVFAIGSAVFARRALGPELRVEATPSGTPTPTLERRTREALRTQPAQPFAAAGAWTMSSLPDCFREIERSRGPLALLRPKFPPESARVKPASVVRRGDCTIVVGEHDLWIARGGDRLRVPPEAQLYAQGDRLTLVVIAGNRAEMRVY